MSLTLGVDLGGTKVLAGVINTESGKVLSTAKKRSRAEHGPDDLIRRLITVAKDAVQQSGAADGVKQVGIGVAGQIDRSKGVVLQAPNLAGMTNVPLADLVNRELGMPVSLFNDVEAAAAGEATHGAGKGQDDLVVVFVGTGIGGAVYHEGRPYSGATGTAGELGHMTIDLAGRLCGCGQNGHLEAYASRTAIVQTILGQLKTGRTSVLQEKVANANPADPGGSSIRSSALADAVASDDVLVRETLYDAATYLGAGLASIVNFYNPPLIILGGGLIQAVDLFFQMVAQRSHQAALPVPRGNVEIVKAALGDNSGIVGAATLAARRGASSASR